jgi:hypothetical protein
MDRLLHRAPSVGSLVKKIMEINPELGTQEIIQIIRQCTKTQGAGVGDYSSLEIVDEQQALKLAKETRH